jgi:hypothetical protein
MGINAQTSVPSFSPGDTLTAANTNLLTNAPPVFAGTATRDAAFGGSGEKVLAEGQLCYLEDSNIVQYYTGADWETVGPIAQKVVQVVSATNNTQASSSVTSFVDTGLTATITPTSATSKILVWVNHAVCFKSSGNLNNGLNMKLFRGATEIGNNLNLGVTNNTIDGFFPSTFLVNDNPATTSATTYKTTFANAFAAASVSVQRGSVISAIVLMEITA